MRKIEKELIQAIEEKKEFSKSNTRVYFNRYENIALIRLHGNLICVHDYKTGKRKYSSAGWRTATTKSRLNALGTGVFQRNGEWYTGSFDKPKKFVDAKF